MATPTSIPKALSQHLQSSQRLSEMSHQLLRAGLGWWGDERSVGGGHLPLTGPSWLRLHSLPPSPWISKTLSSLPPTSSPGEVWAHYTHTGWGIKKTKTKNLPGLELRRGKRAKRASVRRNRVMTPPTHPFPFPQPCQRQRPLPAPPPPP